MAGSVKDTAQLNRLRTQYDEMLAELERYRLLVESVQDYAIFLLDTSGNILTWNKGAQKIKGYTPKEIIGKNFSVFYVLQDIEAKKPERNLEEARKLGRVEVEDWRLRKDGSRFWADVVITALFDNTGTLVGYAKVTRDLTERKKHEDELHKANVRLRRQQRKLEQLTLAKDEFISLASHQLRTPATGVKQFLGIILEGFAGEVDPTQRRYIQKAYDNNEHQIALVNDLLKVAQIDSGKVVLRKTSVNIRQLLKDVVEAQVENFHRRQQHIAVTLPPAAVHAFIDSDYFRTVLENLIDNASKYTPVGGDIHVSAESADAFLKITVADTGVGIAPSDVRKLFKKFTRIPNVLSDRVGGTGLGLYWTNKIVTLHGGRVEVRSELGSGTTFEVYVPLESKD